MGNMSALKNYTTCIRYSRWNEALALLDEMRHTGTVPDVITYNAAISACEKDQQHQQALHLLRAMQRHAIRGWPQWRLESKLQECVCWLAYPHE